jgi:RNA ligase
MVTYLADVVDTLELADMLDSDFVRVQHHPEFAYSILNYTKSAQNCRMWNSATTQCRGLIINTSTGEVIARPFPKFFNYGEEPTQKRKWSRDEPVVVTDKADGSLGISYLGPDDRPRIATRGSFTSDQAIKATQILQRKYPEWYPDEGLTYLFEIIYPENRIVVDYGDTEDLILLGAVNISTGLSVDPGIARLNWSGPVIEAFQYKSLQEALKAAPRPNAEGLVVHFLESDQRVKLKQEDYVELHRIVSNLDKQVVWDNLRNGKPLTELTNALPEEFHTWIHEVAMALVEEYTSLRQDIECVVEHALWSIEDNEITDQREVRKYFAEFVQYRVVDKLQAACFSFFDGDVAKANKVIWNYIKPAKEKNSVRRVKHASGDHV